MNEQQQDRIQAVISGNVDEVLREQWNRLYADYKDAQLDAPDASKFRQTVNFGVTFGPHGPGQPELPGMGEEGETG